MRNNLLGVCGPMPEREQSCVLSWLSQMSLLDNDKEVKKSPPAWKGLNPGGHKMPWGLHVTWELFSCSPGGKRAASLHLLTKLHAWEPAAASWLMFLLSNMGFTAAQAKQVLLPEPNDCSHREEQEEEQIQETPESWISCSCSLSRPPPSAASAQAKQTAQPWTSCSPLWRQPPIWLVQTSSIPSIALDIYTATSEGNQAWCFLGCFYGGSSFQHRCSQPASLSTSDFFYWVLATQQPYLPKCLKHCKSRCVVFSWSQLWDVPTFAHLQPLYEVSVWAQPRGEQKTGGDE